jgi:hypothetical protein
LLIKKSLHFAGIFYLGKLFQKLDYFNIQLRLARSLPFIALHLFQ